MQVVQPSADALPRDARGLSSFLAARGRPGPGKLGIELELGVLRAADLSPVPYEGEAGIGALLAGLRKHFPGEVHEGGDLIALRGERGETITLEPGGQCELSTAVASDLASGLRETRQRVGAMAAVAADLGLLLVGGGLQAAAQERIPWMPKGRYRVMRAYFAALGHAGHLAHHMMQRTLSLQVSLDYSSGQDAAELLRLSFRAAALATATFAASPFSWAREDDQGEFASFRAEAWRFTDPNRQGLVEGVLERDPLDAYAEHALAAPMMFRIRRGGAHDEYVAMHGASFAAALAAGAWEDGASLGEKDLWDHLGSIFTDARLKPGLIELRSTDGPVFGGEHGAHEDPVLAALGEVPAFWVGLAYDPDARRAALALLDAASPDEVREAHTRVPAEGLRAPWRGATVGEAAWELVGIARAGLERRVAAGLEEAWTPTLLDPVLARLERGLAPSDALRQAAAAGGRAGAVALLRVPT
ncbi:MAG: glutamate-cysteine ligase family protein [Planctomycetota bacterium]